MNRDIFYGYSSLSDLAIHAVNDKSEMLHDDRHSRVNAASWAGDTWDVASKLALNGDVTGARRMAPKMLDAVNAMMAQSPRLDPVYRLDEGRWIDVARYVKGEPECWGDMIESEPMPRKGVDIVVNMSVHGGVSAESIDRVGVVIGGAVLGLQAQGYRVTVYAALRAEATRGDRYGHMTIYAPVNPGGAPLDVSRLSIILRPWFLRRIIFSVMETYAADVRRAFGTGSGYGRPSNLIPADLEKITGTKSALAIDMGRVVGAPDRVKDLILRQIKGA